MRTCTSNHKHGAHNGLAEGTSEGHCHSRPSVEGGRHVKHTERQQQLLEPNDKSQPVLRCVSRRTKLRLRPVPMEKRLRAPARGTARPHSGTCAPGARSVRPSEE